MAFGAVGEEFDERRAKTLPGALGGPAGDGVNGEEIIAVRAQGRDAEG